MKQLLAVAGACAALALIPTPAAHADIPWTLCPSGVSGVVGGNTSCVFADNVANGYYASGGASSFWAYSPATGGGYLMSCSNDKIIASFTNRRPQQATFCVAVNGNNANVVVL